MTLFFENRKLCREFVRKSPVCKLEDKGKNQPPKRRWAAVVQRERQIIL